MLTSLDGETIHGCVEKLIKLIANTGPCDFSRTLVIERWPRCHFTPSISRCLTSEHSSSTQTTQPRSTFKITCDIFTITVVLWGWPDPENKTWLSNEKLLMKMLWGARHVQWSSEQKSKNRSEVTSSMFQRALIKRVLLFKYFPAVTHSTNPPPMF